MWQFTLPGLALALLVALTGSGLAGLDTMQHWGISAMPLAIVAGMLVGNSLPAKTHGYFAPGLNIAKQRLLRLGIVLFGFKLTFQDITAVGQTGLLVDVLVLSSTFLLANYLGRYWLGLEKESAILIGAGSAICGAAAVLATEPVIKAKSEHVTIAVATVVVFGTLSMFLYPAVFVWLEHHGWMQATDRRYGMMAGSTIHEVAQALAAGKAISNTAANYAVITKMLRVMMLAPFLLILSIVQQRKAGRQEGGTRSRITIPWFAFGFVGISLFNSLHLLPAEGVKLLIQLDNLLLAIAMAALGLTTYLKAIRQAGVRPLLLAFILFIWLIAGGGVINFLAAKLVNIL